MPIFEYHCNNCGQDFEVLVFSSVSTVEVTCENCSSDNVEKQISTISSCGASSGTGTLSGCGSGGFS